MIKLNKKQQDALDKAFEKLKNNVKKGSRKVSFLILNMSQRNRQKVIEHSAISEKELNLSNIEREQLIDEKLLIPISLSEKTYSISLKGTIIKEFNITKLNPGIENFLNALNYEYWDKSKEISKTKLRDNEKTFLFLMLGLRALSEEVHLDLDSRLSAIKEAYEDAAVFLYKNNFIKTDPTKSYSGAKTEDPFRATLRRFNKLPIKTENIYSYAGRNKVYLDIFSKKQAANNKIEFILKKIFDKPKLDLEEKEKICYFIRKIYEKYAHKIFESKILCSESIMEFEKKVEEVIMVKL